MGRTRKYLEETTIDIVVDEKRQSALRWVRHLRYNNNPAWLKLSPVRSHDGAKRVDVYAMVRDRLRGRTVRLYVGAVPSEMTERILPEVDSDEVAAYIKGFRFFCGDAGIGIRASVAHN